MRKKSEISFTLIFIILALMGFAILVYFIYYIYNNNSPDTEVCHQTVMLRAITPKQIENFVPLKCKTKKICLSYGFFGGSCEDVYGKNKEVRVIKVKNIEDIEKIIADNMAECWSMMGEGKISLFNQYFATTYGGGKVYASCVICARIAFDRSLLDSDLWKKESKKFDILDYMANNKLPNQDKTYLEYLTNGGKIVINNEENLKAFLNLLKEVKKTEENKSQELNNLSQTEEKTAEENNEYIYEPSLSEKTSEEIYINDTKIKISKIEKTGENPKSIAIVFSQISAAGQMESFKNTIKTLGGMYAGGMVLSAASGNFITYMKGTASLITNPITWIIAAIGFSAQRVNVAFQQLTAILYCKENLMSSEDGTIGCSVLKLVEYDEDEIKNSCGIIESIP